MLLPIPFGEPLRYVCLCVLCMSLYPVFVCSQSLCHCIWWHLGNEFHLVVVFNWVVEFVEFYMNVWNSVGSYNHRIKMLQCIVPRVWFCLSIVSVLVNPWTAWSLNVQWWDLWLNLEVHLVFIVEFKNIILSDRNSHPKGKPKSESRRRHRQFNMSVWLMCLWHICLRHFCPLPPNVFPSSSTIVLPLFGLCPF